MEFVTSVDGIYLLPDRNQWRADMQTATHPQVESNSGNFLTN